MRYKAQFQQDFFNDLFKLVKGGKVGEDGKVDPSTIESMDFEFFYNFTWVLAKQADKKIEDPLTWLDSFDSFPIMDIIPEIQDLLYKTIQSKKIENTEGTGQGESISTDTFLVLCRQVDLSLDDLEEMTIGMCLDYIDEYVEMNTPSKDKKRRASQKDFDSF